MPFSKIGERLTARSGIEALMEDLGEALARSDTTIRMLGGGNPARIPAMEAVWRDRMEALLSDDAFGRMLGIYDPPQGNARFCSAMAGYLRHKYGWEVGPENIGITNGGQTAFFYLFNLLAGENSSGLHRKILLPLMPEYIGYANQGLGPEFFTGVMAKIERRDAHRFKYHLNFEQLQVDETIAAICVSRPTNPSGNVLTDDEIVHLERLARANDIPLIVDNAYGAPFPGILFQPITPSWNEQIILTFSLSKLGLPGTRTGIVVARPEIIRAIAAMTAVTGLANGTIGQSLITPLIESGEIDRLVQEIVQPFYRERSQKAQAWIAEFLDNDLNYAVHENEGALFLWLWFPDLPIDAATLYQRLKTRGVLVVPGNFFAYASPEAELHASRCIRLNFGLDDETVREGIRVLGEELRLAVRRG